MQKATILKEASRLARSHGLSRFTRRNVADAVGCSTGLINWHFNTMDALRGAVIEHAIEHEVIEILVQARAERDPRLGRLSPALKERVANHITGR